MNLVKEWLPTLVIFLPLLGILAILLAPKSRVGLQKFIGVVSTVPSLILSVYMFILFDSSSSSTQISQTFSWFTLNIPQQMPWVFEYSVGVDGLSLWFIVLSTVVTFAAALCSLFIQTRIKMFYVLFLLLEVGTTGVFLSTNFFLFFVFFEVTFVTLFFLIGIWGFLHREKAANYFLLYNGIGSAFMLYAVASTLILFKYLGGVSLTLSFAHMDLGFKEIVANLGSLDPVVKTWVWSIFISLLISFGIKLPVFPFHSWMVKVHKEAPLSVVMIHSGILLKMGAYGLVRFCVGFFPSLLTEVAYTLAILGLINILYGAILALVEKDLKKILAYSSISHMGIIIFGISSLSSVGIQGSIFQAISHGLISALLFFLVAVLYQRTKTDNLDDLGGVAKSIPVFSGIFLVGGLALLGLPGTSGFISEFLSFLGIFKTYPIIGAIGVLGLILAAGYSLRAVLKITFGEVNEKYESLRDLKTIEFVPVFGLLALIVAIGVYPALLSTPLQGTLQVISLGIGG